MMDNLTGWVQMENILVKSMAYNNSCFPCCVQMALTNLNYAGQNDSVENDWNDFHMEKTGKGLNDSAPNEDQVHEYLSRTSQLEGEGMICTPTFVQEETLDPIIERLQDEFVNAAGPAALIAGSSHANLFFKRADGKIVWVNPMPDGHLAETLTGPLTMAHGVEGGRPAVRFSDDNGTIVSAYFLMLLR